MKAIETHGLYNRRLSCPKKPGEVELKVMQEMFEATVDGEAYDADKFGQYFRPAGMAARTGDPNVAARPRQLLQELMKLPIPVAETAPATETTEVKADTAPAPKAEEAPTEGNAQDILAMIRARQGQ